MESLFQLIRVIVEGNIRLDIVWAQLIRLLYGPAFK